ncbi:poly(R)-hydroxyalkanoic acid synthase subunit PhaE [Dyella sp.]|uniref:poly(R)-hydroxyalkanoic acid synthase subunit PhaE n=1 Tax=Dyella sp. TaxID=1869338 RepID=UPI002ED05250
MSNQATDFLSNYQALAQQSWDAWTRYLQQQPAAVSPFATAAGNRPEDLLTRSMAGAKAYADWLRSASTSGLGQGDDWQRQMQNLFAGLGGQPFTQAYAGLDSASAHSFLQQWQDWLTAQSGMNPLSALSGAIPNMPGMPSLPGMADYAAFGYTRERQLQQQALVHAMREYADMASRYQSLIQKANAQGFERLQEHLGDMARTDKHVESLKALYDLWVDAAEECYAQIALSDEFKQVYGAMVNAQMKVRQLQQQQLEATCRELGLPTRSEVTALGKRLQELRREMRQGMNAQAPAAHEETDALRAQVAELKRKLAAAQKKTDPIVPKAAPKARVGTPKKTAKKAAAGRTGARGSK